MKRMIKASNEYDSRLEYLYSYYSQIVVETPMLGEVQDFIDSLLRSSKYDEELSDVNVAVIRANKVKYPRQGSMYYLAFSSKDDWDKILDWKAKEGYFDNLDILPPKEANWDEFEILKLYD